MAKPVARKLFKLWSLCLAILITLAGALPSAITIHGQTTSVRRVNAPFFSPLMKYEEAAIFWFGRVTPTENYADVRVGYNNSELYVQLSSFDRRLWFDPAPTPADLMAWDAASLFIHLAGKSRNHRPPP